MEVKTYSFISVANINIENSKKVKRLIKTVISSSIKNNYASYFLNGLSRGYDLFAAEQILKLKNKCSNIILESVIPFEEQPKYWTESERELYFEITSKSDIVNLLQAHYSKNCISQRNKYMIDNSDIVIAVWNEKNNSVSHAIRYSNSIGKKVIVIDSIKLNVYTGVILL